MEHTAIQEHLIQCQPNIPEHLVECQQAYEDRTHSLANRCSGYRRRDSVPVIVLNGEVLANSYILPINADIPLDSDVHDNVQESHKLCNIKYLYKYLSRMGVDVGDLPVSDIPDIKPSDGQKALRAVTYELLHDQVGRLASDSNLKVGISVILPSTSIGSPRHMYEKYQDSLVLARRFGKPDLFITFTCNPRWKEIESGLRENETASNRPDLIIKVFNLKVKALLKRLIAHELFSRVVARTLPHCLPGLYDALLLGVSTPPSTQSFRFCWGNDRVDHLLIQIYRQPI
jgi:hypothetical protein